jgi:lipid-binding SYLF domain-containing protein
MKLDTRITIPALMTFLALAGCAGDKEDAQPAPDAPPAAAPQPAPAPKAEAMPEETTGAATGMGETIDADPEYAEVISSYQANPTVAPFFENAYGFVVFPTVGKGGLGIGAAFGDGRVYVDNKQTGTATISEISIGLQAGGQAFTEIIFFEDQRAYEEFTAGNFEFDAEASGVAINAAANAQASTTGTSAGAGAGEDAGAGAQATAGYKKGMATFTYSKGGLMADATIGGQKFKFTPLGE